MREEIRNMMLNEKIAVICVIFVIVMGMVIFVMSCCSPLRSEREIAKREARKREKRKYSTDILEVESKGDT